MNIEKKLREERINMQKIYLIIYLLKLDQYTDSIVKNRNNYYKQLKIMTAIEPEPIEIVLNKLRDIRCCTGCLSSVNYLVFGHGNYRNYQGLYCGTCLSTLPEINKDHFINL